MKIVFDARCIRPGMTGVGHYAANLLEHLPATMPNDEIIVLWLRNESVGSRPATACAAPNVRWIEIDADPQSHPTGDWWLHHTLPKLLQQWGADVYHNPAFLIPLSLNGKTSRSTRLIASVHDFSVFSFPQSYPWRFRLYLRTMLGKILRQANTVLFDSHFVQQEAQRLFPDFKVGSSHVIPLAQGPHFTASAPNDFPERCNALNLPEDFLLMVGTLEHRKNPQFFLRFYEALGHQQKILPLVWAGGLGHDHKSILSELEPLIQRGLFIHKTNFSKEDLSTLYHRAKFLLYPSHEEGFGLPLLEAMASGLPVLAAHTSCLPEVVGDGGYCLPLENPCQWVETLQKLLDDPNQYETVRQMALQRATTFSWQRTAEKTAKVYREG